MGISKDILRELDIRGWSQNELARRSGKTPQDISGIITNDSNPQINTVIKIADGFGITVDELVCHPKPVPRIRGRPTTAKDVRNCLSKLGLGKEDIEDIMAVVKVKLDRAKGRGRGDKAATGG